MSALDKTYRVTYTRNVEDRDVMDTQRHSVEIKAPTAAEAARRYRQRVFSQGWGEAPIYFDVHEWYLQDGKPSLRRGEVVRYGIEKFKVYG